MVVGDAILNSDAIKVVSCTGYVRTVVASAMGCVKRRKKVQLRLGGENPLIVAADADHDVAVTLAINGSHFSTGQRCIKQPDCLRCHS